MNFNSFQTDFDYRNWKKCEFHTAGRWVSAHRYGEFCYFQCCSYDYYNNHSHNHNNGGDIMIIIEIEATCYARFSCVL